jgi:hypothetical protein
MKKNIIKLFSLALATTLFVSCNSNEEVASIVPIAKPTMTIAVAPTVTVQEGDLVPFTLTLSAPAGHDFDVFLILDKNASTADGTDSDVDEGYSNTAFQKKVTFPAFTTSFSSVIEIAEDDLPEPTETLRVMIGDTRTSAASFTSAYTTISILNVVKPQLDLTFHFDRSFSSPSGATFNLCDLSGSALTNSEYDVDFILYDEFFNFIPNFDAQTGACTEAMSLKLADYPDGLYHITAYLYANADLDYASLPFPLNDIPTFDIPITVDYMRSGSFSGKYTQEPVNYFTSDSPVDSENQLMDIVISTVGTERKFTVQNTVGVVSGSGRMATKPAFKSKRVKL